MAKEEIMPTNPHCYVAAAKATAATLSDPDGVARTSEAIEAVWDWAETLAHEYNCQNPGDIDD